MHFGNLRDMSVKIEIKKKYGTPSGKRLVHSVSGRHNDDRLRNAPGVFQKASESFLNFRSLPTYHGDCRSALYPCYVYVFYTLYWNEGRDRWFKVILCSINIPLFTTTSLSHRCVVYLVKSS